MTLNEARQLLSEILRDENPHMTLPPDEDHIPDKFVAMGCITTELFMGLEKRFGVRFTSREVDSVNTVGDMLRLMISAAPVA